MCCRYFMEEHGLERIVDAARNSPLTERFTRAGFPLVTEGEVFPSNVVPTVATNKQGKIAIFPMMWGFNVPGIDMIVNARTETAAEKPLFKDSWAAHRCIVPASYYFEWEHETKPNGKRVAVQKYAIQPQAENVTWLCGLYRIEDGFPHFVILTLPPAETIAFIHDRMPLMIRKERISKWVQPGIQPETLIDGAVQTLAFEAV